MSIKAIHTLKGKLGLSDADYRALLMRQAGVSSSKDLSPEGDRAVMAALRDLESASGTTAAKTRADAKIWALWYALKPYLPEPERSIAYLLGIVSRAAGVRIGSTARLPHLSPREKYNIIEALKSRLNHERSSVPF